MNSRIRILITALCLCHLLLAPGLVTTRLLAQTSPALRGDLPDAPSTPDFPPSLTQEDVDIHALEQEQAGPVSTLRGHAEIHYESYILYADKITYNKDSGEAKVEGNVVLDGGPYDEHVKASRGSYNIRSQTGRFEIVNGTIGLKLRTRRNQLTTQNPFAFSGKVVLKTTPTHYLVYDGTITTCDLPQPKWQFDAAKVSVEVGGNAKIYRSTFRVRGVPVVYFPFATHPTEREPRSSGLLIPSFGRSSTKGYLFGESGYWAVNRSFDVRAGVEYMSRRGWAPQVSFRLRPSETSFLNLKYFGVFDRGIHNGGVFQDQGGHNVKLTGEGAFGHNFRGVANIDYLSSYVFRLAFTEVYTQAVNSEVKSFAFLSNTTDGYSLNAAVRRYQNFESTTPGDVITILHAPGLESSSVDRPLSHLPFYWSYDAAVEGLSRSEPQFRTAPLLGRFDISPALSLPLLFRGWSFRPQVSVRDTFYTQRLATSSNQAVSSNASRSVDSATLNRKALQTGVELRAPDLVKIFDGELLGRKWKHVIEPRVNYRYVTGVSNFNQALLFDARDILSDTNEVEYGITNRFYSKSSAAKTDDCAAAAERARGMENPEDDDNVDLIRPKDEPPVPCNPAPMARETLTWELSQKYFIDPTFGGALIPGQRNVFSTTTDLTGIAFVTDSRRLSPLISRLRLQTTPATQVEWDLDYDLKKGRLNTSNVFLNYRFSHYTLGGGDAFLQAPGQSVISSPGEPVVFGPQRFNQLRLLLAYGGATKRGLNGALSAGYDTRRDFLQYASIQTTYNWDCCGFSLEYRRFALGTVRNENQYRFNFAIANVGSFGTLRRRERLY